MHKMGTEFLLREHGLLGEDGYLHGQRGIPNADVLEGLFIDDYFVLDLGRNKTGKAEEKFATSQKAYAADNLYGSPHKDIHGQSDGTLIGAEFTGSEGWARRGLVTVGAPRARRAALSWWTILALSKPRILGQLVHVLVGSWNSIFMYRRPLFVLFATIYDALRLPRDRLVRLDARAKDDLLLAAVLAPLGVTEIDAPILPQIFALDASPSWGAVTSTVVAPATARALWTRGNQRGGYTRLDSHSKQILRTCGKGIDEKSENPFLYAPGRCLPKDDD